MSNANEFFMDWLGGEAFTRRLSVPRNIRPLQTSSSLLACNNFILVSLLSCSPEVMYWMQPIAYVNTFSRVFLSWRILLIIPTVFVGTESRFL